MKNKAIYPHPGLADPKFVAYSTNAHEELWQGITLLEHYAGQIHAELIGNLFSRITGDDKPELFNKATEHLARISVACATELIKELEKEQQ